MDFAHPMKETWPGFLNPHYRQCPDCENGYSPAGAAFGEIVTTLMHTSVDDEFLRMTVGLAGREQSFGIHDRCDCYTAGKKILAAAGIESDRWGVCKNCDGDACDPDAKAAWEGWENTEPPTGEGWQMWETTSEGSPMSPVCESPEALARWLADNGASSFGRDMATYDEWLRMIGSGWAPSAVFTPSTGLVSGVVATPESPQ